MQLVLHFSQAGLGWGQGLWLEQGEGHSENKEAALGKEGTGWTDHGGGRKCRGHTPRAQKNTRQRLCLPAGDRWGPHPSGTSERDSYKPSSWGLVWRAIVMVEIFLQRSEDLPLNHWFESLVPAGQPYVFLSLPGLPPMLGLGQWLPGPSRPAGLTERHQEAPHACSVLRA